MNSEVVHVLKLSVSPLQVIEVWLEGVKTLISAIFVLFAEGNLDR